MAAGLRHASQLYARCHLDPKLVWYRVGESGPEVIAENAFAVLIGGGSCSSGTRLVEANLEHAPYTTYTPDFTIEPPRPTFPE